MQAAAIRLRELCERREDVGMPSRILHSPYERTTQTAQYCAESFHGIALEEQPVLVPDSSVNSVEAMLADCLAGEECHVVLASHQPLVSYLLDHFLGPDHPVPPLVPAAMATFSLDVAAAEAGTLLIWSVPPLFEQQLQ